MAASLALLRSVHARQAELALLDKYLIRLASGMGGGGAAVTGGFFDPPHVQRAGLALPQALQAELALALGGLAAPREAAGGGALLRQWVGVALRLAAVTPGENAGARAGRAQLAEELEGCWQG
jgi:hypothetical protein